MVNVVRACRSACLITALSLAAHAAQSRPAAPIFNADAGRLLAHARARQPIGFEPNQGRATPGAAFTAQASGYQVALLRDGSLVQRVEGSAAESRMTLLGAHPRTRLTDQRLAATSTNATGIEHTYARVRYRNVYPGVDAIYHSRSGAVEYDFEVAPGADTKVIRLSFRDAKQVTVEPGSGELLVTDGSGAIIRHSRPEIYQSDAGVRQSVAGGYRLLAPRVVAFEVGAYDHARPLTIDPTINVTRFLSGNNNELATAVTVDAGGNTYIAGLTNSTTGFPAGTGAVAYGRKNCTLVQDKCVTSAYVVKLDPAGNIVATMLFGGIGSTAPNALAVDGTYVYVAGVTNSPAITTAQGKAAPVNYIYGTVHKADDRVDHRAFLAKFSLQLTTLDEVTLLGSQDDTGAFGLFVDAGGSAYLTGTTSGPGFPTTNGAFQTPSAGRSDVFVTRLDYFGSLSGTYGPVYSARFGGSDIDQAGAIAVNAAGAAWITGKTCSADFPLTPGLSHGTPGIDASFACTAFLTELDPTGSTYQYSIAFGGSKLSGADPAELNDMGLALVLDGTNGAYVGGETRSLNFYTVGAPGHPPVEAVAPCNHSISDDPPAYCITIGFVTYVDAGFNIKYSTYLGGVYSSAVRSLARNSRGDIYAAGTIYANTVGFPGTTPVTLNPTGGFVSKLSSTLDTVNWTQLLGATANGVVARNPTALTTYISTAGERYPTAGSTDAFMVQMSDVIAVTVPPGPGCGIRCATK